MSGYTVYTVWVYPDGTRFWYLNDKCHREDGPAVEWNTGTKLWYLNGKLHREDGPAIEWRSGTKEWYLRDKQLTKKEFLKKMKKIRIKSKTKSRSRTVKSKS